jgi:ribosomal protein S18 acetylase RimI-like enzyme
MIAIHRATLDDLDILVALFDGYRSFYEQPVDSARSRAFLDARLRRDESVIFLAQLDDGSTAGFTQLYPFFSSVRAARVWVLNDLFVAADARRRGVANALLDAATAFARDDGAIRLELETTPDNVQAQALYRAAGWHQFDETLRFRLPLAQD